MAVVKFELKVLSWNEHQFLEDDGAGQVPLGALERAVAVVQCSRTYMIRGVATSGRRAGLVGRGQSSGFHGTVDWSSASALLGKTPLMSILAWTFVMLRPRHGGQRMLAWTAYSASFLCWQRAQG